MKSVERTSTMSKDNSVGVLTRQRRGRQCAAHLICLVWYTASIICSTLSSDHSCAFSERTFKLVSSVAVSHWTRSLVNG